LDSSYEYIGGIGSKFPLVTFLYKPFLYIYITYL
jgi:hypothetical protein